MTNRRHRKPIPSGSPRDKFKGSPNARPTPKQVKPKKVDHGW